MPELDGREAPDAGRSLRRSSRPPLQRSSRGAEPPDRLGPAPREFAEPDEGRPPEPERDPGVPVERGRSDEVPPVDPRLDGAPPEEGRWPLLGWLLLEPLDDGLLWPEPLAGGRPWDSEPLDGRPFDPRPSEDGDREPVVRRGRSSSFFGVVLMGLTNLSLAVIAAPRHESRAVPTGGTALDQRMSGGVLLSHPVTRAVPSALKGLASGFGM